MFNRGWAFINLFDHQGGCMFEVGAYLTLGT